MVRTRRWTSWMLAPSSSAPMLTWCCSLKARTESTSAPRLPSRYGSVSDAGEYE